MHIMHSPRDWRRDVTAALLGTLAPLFAARAQGTTLGAIRGTVRDSGGGGIVGAEVSAEGVASRTRSDSTGSFRIERIAAGRVVLRIRRLGYASAAQPVSVAGGSVARVDVVLAGLAARLPTVVVREGPTASESRLAGFNARRLKKVGYFITRDRIDRSNAATMADLLREIPGVRFVSPPGGPAHAVRLRGANCAPLVFVDGFAATAGEFDLDDVDAESLEGVEIYPDMMSVPPALLGPRGLERCGVIAMWTRPFRPRAHDVEENEEDLERLVRQAKAYTADAVDVQAAPIAGSVVPGYPDSLWAARVSGRAVLEFVVDSGGAVVDGTVRTVTTTDARFAAAARAALADARFTAARRGGRRVAQVVQLPFAFDRPNDSAPGRP